MRRILRRALPLCVIAVSLVVLCLPAEARPRGGRVTVQPAAGMVCDNDGRCAVRALSGKSVV